ncbi:MAG: Gfo/Idh/MocA family oxidoreductase [Anaerolineae bacterium]|nr:Gfo/Idh/MocA family oxidoreductase [Anaerolineae bacterium]
MLKVGILGAGFMGSTHARAFAKQMDTQIVAISSRSPEKATALAQEVGAEATTDHLALATDPRVDVISNTLPTHLHQELTVAALNAGKHVFLEKPMGLSVAECEVMIAAAQQNGRLLMLAHVLRFWPEYVALVEFVKSGALGRSLSATAKRLSARPTWGDWFANPECTGGAVLDLQVHDLDMLNWLFGTPQTVYARGQKGRFGGWDHTLTLLDYGEVKAFAEGTILMPAGYPFTMTLAVLCENGSVEYNFRASGPGVASGTAPGTSLMVYEAGKEPRALTSTPSNGYENQVAAFIECVRTNRPPDRATAEDGRLAVQTALAARQSLETGEVVRL